MAAQRKRLGEALLELKLIDRKQLSDALEAQRISGDKLGHILVKNGVLSELQLTETLGFMLGIPYIPLSKMKIDPKAVSLISPNLAHNHKIIPVARKDGRITVAMSDPLNYQAIDDVRMATGLEVVPVLAGEGDIDTALRQYLALNVDARLERILGELVQEEKGVYADVSENEVLNINDDAPVVRMVNSILAQAVEGYASDVHIEPREDNLQVRFRIDGELYQVLNLPRKLAAAVVSRIKVMAGLDIAEKRMPQDGRIHMNLEGRKVDFRISTLPTVYGEKVVLRILDPANALTCLEQLGLNDRNYEQLLSLVRRPHGMLLATGPTGSGKTTTLYSILGEMNSARQNIITLEDPVEYSLPGINQVQMNPRAGLTFATGLRFILRQDPDVIMVGEIRDRETAQLAVQAALTGHLVLSTLHTNSAVGTIARLGDMGIDNYLLASSLKGVVSQRLVRRLCPHCCKPYRLDEATAVRLGIPEASGGKFYRPAGCNMCLNLGYRGRMALQEVLNAGPLMREAINKGYNSEDDLKLAAIQEGMITLKRDGVDKAKQGLTSLEEVMKVVLLGG